MLKCFGEKLYYFGKNFAMVGLPSQAHSATQHADAKSDRCCETERVWLARVSHGIQEVLFVIKWPTALLCLFVFVLVRMSHPSAAVCHRSCPIFCQVNHSVCDYTFCMCNPSTTACQDVPHFFFVRWHSLCVCVAICLVCIWVLVC